MEDWLARRRAAAASPTSSPASSTPPLRGEGAPIYARDCAACHGASGRDFSGEYVGKVDAHRRDRHRPRPARQLHPRPRGRTRTCSTPNSAPSASRPSARPTATPTRPLDGLWLRAPYLHNGSVPDARRAARAAGGAPRRVPARLRRLRPAGDGLRQRPGPHRPRGLAAALLLRHHAPASARSARRRRRR